MKNLTPEIINQDITLKVTKKKMQVFYLFHPLIYLNNDAHITK